MGKAIPVHPAMWEQMKETITNLRAELDRRRTSEADAMQLLEECEAERDRLLVECEAWRDGRLWNCGIDCGGPPVLERGDGMSRVFDTIDAAVDALEPSDGD